jgi:hypothetical protein
MNNTILSQSIKELYGFTYIEHLDSMRRRGWLAVKIGDANNTEERWSNSDISGANEATAKLAINVWHNLDGIRRDYDVRPELTKHFPPHEELAGKGTEWHSIPVSKEIVALWEDEGDSRSVLDYAMDQIQQVFVLKGKNNNKPSFVPRNYQQTAIDFLVNEITIKGPNCKIISEMAPRSGKTLINLAVAKELNEKHNYKLAIIPVYWLSALTSFKHEIATFKEFTNWLYIDTVANPDWVQQADDAIAKNQFVVIGVSLRDRDNWTGKHSWINAYTGNTYVISDEADFGNHTDNQIEKYEYLISNKAASQNITSGSNMHRMARITGSDVNSVYILTYSELENSRDKDIVHRSFIRMTVGEMLTSSVNGVDEKLKPTWTKILNKPLAQKNYIGTFFKGLLDYEPEWGNSLDQAVGEELRVIRVKVNATKENMKHIAKLIEDNCPDHNCFILNGDETNNRKAEDESKYFLRRVKLGYDNLRPKTIFLSNMMGSRSWSVGDVQACVTLSDGGDLGAFMQETSRCLTPISSRDPIIVTTKSKGYIIDCAFDQNRTTQIDMALIHEASVLSKKHGWDLPTSIRYLFNCINLQNCDEFGVQLVSADELIASWEDQSKILDVADIATDISGILEDPNALAILSNVNSIERKDKTKLDKLFGDAKTYGTKGKKESAQKFSKEDRDARLVIINAIKAINSSATTVFDFANNGESFRECIKLIKANPIVDKNFKEMYNIGVDDILYLLDNKYLPESLLDICVYNSSKEYV